MLQPGLLIDAERDAALPVGRTRVRRQEAELHVFRGRTRDRIPAGVTHVSSPVSRLRLASIETMMFLAGRRSTESVHACAPDGGEATRSPK